VSPEDAPNSSLETKGWRDGAGGEGGHEEDAAGPSEQLRALQAEHAALKAAHAAQDARIAAAESELAALQGHGRVLEKKLLDLLDQLGIADDTVVFYSTDNGPHMNTWPDAGMTPFRNEKNSNWEGGWRVPAFVRWPGKIEAGSITNEIVHHMDWLPTFADIAGNPDIKEQLLKGQRLGKRKYKVHLDGYNILPYLKGDEAEAPRKEFMYWTDDGDLAALRFNNWKVLFMEQRAHGFDVWQDPFVSLRFPKLENLRMDPFERAEHEAIGYGQWRAERMFALVPAQAFVAKWIESFKEFPPRQKAASFSVDDALQKLVEPKIP